VSELERLRAEVARLRDRIAQRDQRLVVLDGQLTAYKSVLASIPYSVFWKSFDLTYQGCNPSFATLCGLASPEEIAGRTDYDLPWPREFAEAYRAADREIIEQETSMVEERLIYPGGEMQAIMISKDPLRDAAGKVIGVVGLFTDITQRKRMELELKKAKEIAEAADQAKGDFLATVSHELRTPLGLILGPLEDLVNRGELTARDRTDVERVLRNAWRLKNLVDDTLEFTKGAARMQTPRLEPVDVGALTGELIDEAQTAASSRQLTLELVADPLPELMLDPRMYERILLNLVGNALKFTQEGGSVTVVLHDHGEAFEIEVRDTGIGIDSRDLERLFQRFQQVDTSSTRRYEGTGLGLALVKQFAELMGGAVTVESEPGRGSSFSVVLPKWPADDALRPSEMLSSVRSSRAARIAVMSEPMSAPSPEGIVAAVSAPHIDDGRPSIALAEDNADLRAYAAEVLGDRYRVTTYRNGTEALAGIRAHPPDVVVSDVMMPGLDGHQLVTAMKAVAELRYIPIILLTAQAGRDVLVTSLERGADDFLNKPFSAPELVARVGVAVRLSKAYRELQQRNRELTETRDMLIESEKLSALGRLLTQLSHEINNPMTVIMGNLPSASEHLAAMTAMLADYRAAAAAAASTLPGVRQLEQRYRERDLEFITEDFPALLASVQEAAERVQHIQDDLRAFLRGQPLEKTAGDLNLGLRTTVEMMRRGLPPDIRLHVTYGDLPAVHFHAGQIKQVILNILQNAVDAVRPSGVIEVVTFAEAGRVTIQITDDGPGIPAELGRKIFEPFFTTKIGKGSGIGLAVCQQIMSSHGGHIAVDEAHHPGARFEIELPSDPPDAVGAGG
jgi:PAS domain S-box-containing protein